MTENELADVMAHLLDGAEQKLGTLVLEAVRPFVQGAFKQGLRAGIAVARDGAARGFETAERNIDRALSPGQARRASDEPRRQSKRRSTGRAAPGTIRPIVEAILSGENRGLRIVDIQRQAAILDRTIASASISNELRRNSGTRYRQIDSLWFLIAEKERAEGLDRGNATPRPEAEGEGVGAPTSTPSVGRAALAFAG